jgi:hypothetical protein
MANRILDLSWRQFARSLGPLWVAHAVLVLAAIGVRQMSLLADPRAAIHLVVALPVVAVAYLATLRLAAPGLLTMLRRGTVQSVSHGVAVHKQL